MEIKAMSLQELQAHALKLQIENENLKKNQEAFQNALIDEVKRIEQTPKMWRFLQYGKLLFQLIDTVRAAVEANKKA